MSGEIKLALMLEAFRRWRSVVTTEDRRVIDVVIAVLERAEPAVFADFDGAYEAVKHAVRNEFAKGAASREVLVLAWRGL